ncbi:GNAT family N-acetyltransferase, partial [Frankia sp. AgKG'84/4]|nr:GNAT family N-acetyltransferase [Frankia sp. AgKG'84/4]
MSAVSSTLETTRRSPLFCDVDLTARIEGAEVRLIAEASAATRRRRGDAAGFVIPIAGGVASFAEDDSPLNKVAGLGFGGVPSAAELDEVERAFAAYGVPVQVELPHLVDPEIGVFLTERGYRLVSFENVLGRALTGEHREVNPPGVTIRASGSDELDAWLEVMAEGVAEADTQGLPSHEEFPRDVLLGAMRDLAAASGVRRYGALRDGVLAGG